MQKTNVIWFKRKRYGLGWYPVTWQGWLVLAVYVFLIITFTRSAAGAVYSDSDLLSHVILPVVILTILLIAICIKTGESLSWQWGDKNNNK